MTLGFWKSTKEYYTVFHIRKQRAKNKHTEETAFCPLQKKKNRTSGL